MAIEPYSSMSGNLSHAWTEVFLRLLTPGVDALSPVLVNVSEFENGVATESVPIRERLDTELIARGKRSIQTVANTIFPESLWRPGTPNNDTDLYGRYERVWPRIRRDPANRHGVYFRRLTSFRPASHPNDEPVNQLQRLIEIFRDGTHRRSALQAGFFDPIDDHRNGPYLGFPCLQQVAFTPLGADGLAVTGFYAMQYQLEKAYGNYLGLCRLGRFVAAQLDRRLVRMTCMASLVTRGDFSKANLALFAEDLRTATAVREEELRPA